MFASLVLDWKIFSLYLITDVVTKEGWKKVGNTDPMWFPELRRPCAAEWDNACAESWAGFWCKKSSSRWCTGSGAADRTMDFPIVLDFFCWAKWVRPSWLSKKKMSRYFKGYFSISRIGIWNDYQDHNYLKVLKDRFWTSCQHMSTPMHCYIDIFCGTPPPQSFF